MSSYLKTNKFFVAVLVLSLIIGGLTFSNLPGPATSLSVQTVNGVNYNFADYGSLTHEQLALFNYLDTIVSQEYQPYGNWSGWNAELFAGLHHYVLAFMSYATAGLFESTPGYRTDYYRNFAYDLIKKMNTTVAEFNDTSIEYREWMNPSYGFSQYHYPNATNSSDLYVGGYRGPANIMWTAHYALMMELYERNFLTGELASEIGWYVRDWNNTLTTDGYGNSKEGGIFGVGLIPCEPYIVFVQCNSIPIYTTELYDNLYDTSYMDSGIWDYGLDFINTTMQDGNGLFTDGYYTMEPVGFHYPSEGPPPTFPGLALDRVMLDGRPRVSSYCNAWSLAFLEYTQPEETIKDYPVFVDLYGKDLSADKMYMVDSYYYPSRFGTYDILGSLFTLALAKQRGDVSTRDRILNFLYGSFNKQWSADGRTLYYDTASLEPFLQAVLAFGWIWGTTPVTIRNLADARPSAFWGYPYISHADDDNMWVYQAQWNPVKEGFVLNIRVDQLSTLTFSNFDHVPTAYSGGSAMAQLTTSGADYTLSLQPGTYNIVIV
jgi:hypothetical protein